MNRNVIALGVAALLFAGRCGRPGCRSDQGCTKASQQTKPDYSPYPDQKFPNRVFWGVAHVHTGYSFDCGNVRGNADPRRPLQGCDGRGSRHGQRPALQAGPAAGLGLHHRPCRVSRHLRSDSRRQPRSPRQPAGQALVRDVEDEPSGGRQSRHRSGRLHADRQACLRREQTHGRRPGRTPPRQPRSGTSRASSPRCTASSGPPRPAATTFIAPSSSATARTA